MVLSANRRELNWSLRHQRLAQGRAGDPALYDRLSALSLSKTAHFPHCVGMVGRVTHRRAAWLERGDLEIITAADGSVDCRHLRDSDFPRRKGGMSDRHGCALGTGQGFNLRTKLLRERLDDPGAETGFPLSEDAVRLADAVVAD